MVKKFSEFEDARCGLETLTDPSLFLVLGFEGGNDFRVPVSEGGNYFRVLGFEGGNDFRVPVSVATCTTPQGQRRRR